MLPSRILLIVLLTLCISAAAFAGGFQLNEHGARAMAQAGAFAARATDGSAIYFNPGGLGFQKDASLYFGTTVIFPQSAFYGPLQDNTNQRTALVNQVFTPINFYASTPLSWVDGLTVGIGVNNPFGLGTEWPENWAGKYLSTKADLQSFFFTPTVAYRVSDFLSIGGGFNYATGSVKIQRAVAAGFGTSFGQDPTVKLDLSGHGFGWNAGIMAKATPEISVGLSYRSQVKVKADGTANFNPAYSVLPAGDASAEITLPATGYAGIAYTGENFEIEADYQYVGWSSYDKLAITFKANGTTSEQPKNYKNTYIARLGGEYTVSRLHIRAGFYYDHSPVDNAYSEPLLPDANREGYNIGFGYDLTKHLSMDAAWLYIHFNDRKAENTIPEISFDGTSRSTANLFALNFEYKF
jgi:long-chain fatty acid transport protein